MPVVLGSVDSNRATSPEVLSSVDISHILCFFLLFKLLPSSPLIPSVPPLSDTLSLPVNTRLQPVHTLTRCSPNPVPLRHYTSFLTVPSAIYFVPLNSPFYDPLRRFKEGWNRNLFRLIKTHRAASTGGRTEALV